MTCADARHIILSADPTALRDRTDPVLRAHLEGCADCAAAASHVVADVDRLRAALIARGARSAATIVKPRRRSPKRVAMAVVPVALAAELAFFAFMGARDAYNPLTDRRIIDDSVTSMLPGSPAHVDTGEVMLPPKVTPAKVVKAAAAPKSSANDSTHDEADSTRRAAAPSEYVPDADMAQLQVAPANRRERVAVIATSNPKITVVWLSKGDSL